MSQLEALLQQCTVKLTLPGRVGWGTGFFVAPDQILTCAHVVQAVGRSVQVWWQKQELVAVVERSLPDYDLALLRVTLPADANPPCVYLDVAIQSRDPLYLFGYPDQDFPNGCPVTFNCEGLTGDEPALIKFALGQVRPGMSGSPLLNQRTGKVCGMVKFTRDRSFDLGGGAVSTATILAQFPELQSQNHQFHQQDLTWSALLPKPGLPDQRDLQDYRYRQTLLNTVRNNWIKDVLETSLYSKAQIELGLEERFDVLELAYEIPETSTQHLAKGTKVIDQFDELGAGQSLLILGAPGSGKTTTLLELARDLITRAEQDVNLPMPVIFNLSSWTNPKQKIQNWLVRELSTKYRVSRALGRTWIREQKLLLLLDGLDEVREDLRGDCIQAINRFYREFGQTEIVVCSRLKDYENLRERFQFQEAIILQPLTQNQISDYLNQAGEKLAGVRMAWRTDPVMQELAQTPLMLSVMALAYQGMSAEELPQTSLEERQDHLWDKYIDRMFERKKGDRRYSKEEASVWLSFLAQKMVQESQTIFLIERIQPTWLKPGIQRWMYRLGTGLIAGLAIEWIYGLVAGITAGLLSLQMLLGLMIGLISGFIGSWNSEIKLFETFGWRWSLGNIKQSFILGLLCPIIGLGFWLVGSPIGLTAQTLEGSLKDGLFAGLLVALINTLFTGLVKSSVEKKSSPNQGVWQSAIRSGISTLITLLLAVPLISRLNIFIPISILLGWVSLYAGGLACFQHITIRNILFWAGKSPRNYTDFLNYVCDRMFLQHVGGGYQFSHDLLRRHLVYFKQPNPKFSKKNQLKWINLLITSVIIFILFIGGIAFPLFLDIWGVGPVLAKLPATSILKSGNRLVVDKLTYHFHNPQRGNLISFNPTANFTENTKVGNLNFDLKQIIGFPGERVEFKKGRVYINCQTLQINCKPLEGNDFMHPAFRDYRIDKIPDDSYLVIVKNPDFSEDTLKLTGQLVRKSSITGRIAIQF